MKSPQREETVNPAEKKHWEDAMRYRARMTYYGDVKPEGWEDKQMEAATSLNAALDEIARILRQDARHMAAMRKKPANERPI